MKACRRQLAALLGVVSISSPAAGPAVADALQEGFQAPPEAAKPRVWWHWMNGNVTQEGITADLEWMRRVGIGGFQMFDADIGTSKYVDKRLVWMTPEWKAAFRHAAAEADRLGLEMGMAASPGWSQAGGPWVQPSQAMKKVVWSMTPVSGPGRVALDLPKPPSVDGPFQDMAYAGPVPMPGDHGPGQPAHGPSGPGYYADVRVVAYPASTRPQMAALKPKITSSAGPIDGALLMDGRYSASATIAYAADAKQHWIQVAFDRPYPAASFSAAFISSGQMMQFTIPPGSFQSSLDGRTWTTLVALPGPGHHVSNLGVRTYSFPKTTAKYFRLVLDHPPVEPVRAFAGLPALHEIRIADFQIGADDVVDRWQGKAQYGNLLEYPWNAEPPGLGLPDAAQVLDLTAQAGKDGALRWNAPPGDWEVLRVGTSLVGAQNHPASPEATGYEVDKLNAADVRGYFDTYLGMIKEAAGPYFGKSLRVLLMDGIESGVQNASTGVLDEFRARRGYDPTPYLPILTGRAVQSIDVSERFLWDYRRTLADLIRDNYYAQASDQAKALGLGLYAQAVGPNAPANADALEVKGRVAIPMGEFWTTNPGDPIVGAFEADLREAASAAHIYGKPIVAAESFTTYHARVPAWGQSPFYLKPFADQALALGVNQFVIHTADHQPFVDAAHRPGLTLGPFGQNFTRNITWAEQSKAWLSYLTRASYMLQQGRTVADVAYFYGEGTPANTPFWKELQPAAPEGYSYDWVNAEVLLTASVEGGEIVLASGARYRMLVLPAGVDRLTLPMVRKLRDLVEAGATLMAPRPGKSPSLADYPRADAEIVSIVNQVWGGIDGKGINFNVYGKGKVVWGFPPRDLLAADRIAPDVEYNRPRADTKLVWTHRRTAEADIYFVASRNDAAQDITVSFRVEGKRPELWRADTGTTAETDYATAGGRTAVPLHFDRYGSVFVVFRHKAAEPARTLAKPVRTALRTVEGPWRVEFPPNLGAPATANLPKLASLTASKDAGVKYFSGTAAYVKELDAPSDWFRPGARLILDLGEVRDLAEVRVNGAPVPGVLWKPPFEADVTGLLRPGRNRIEVQVTNLWTNRMVGDQQPGAKRYTFTNFPHFTKDTPLLDAGLLGPVAIVRQEAR